ncbi:MAG: hypothetical protein ACRCZE_00675, partial [Candidatus Altimarinota bacterium]
SSATNLVLAASAGDELYIPVQPFGTATQVPVPQGVDHREVIDNGNNYEFSSIGGVTLGVEGTIYSADWISESVVRFTCTEGLITLNVTSSGNPLDFNINGTQGDLPAGFTVDVDVMSGSIISGPDLLSCGDGNVDVGEECDGDEMNNQSCTTMGYDSGSISCNDDCTLNTSDCENGQGGAGGSGSSSGSGGGSNSTSSSSGGGKSNNVNPQEDDEGCSVSQPTTSRHADLNWMLMMLVFGLALSIRRR